MKQIFDWLREQIKGLSNAEADYYYASSNDVIDREDALELINEAEAKWESEVCEWKRFKHFELIIAPHDKTITLQTFDLKDYPYCPICGKPIKISEVE